MLPCLRGMTITMSDFREDGESITPEQWNELDLSLEGITERLGDSVDDLQELPQPEPRIYTQEQMDHIIDAYNKTVENFEQIAQLFTQAFATGLQQLGAVLAEFQTKMGDPNGN